MEKTLYVGIDVSKDKLDVAVTYEQDKITSFSSFSNSLKGSEALLKWTKNFVHAGLDPAHRLSGSSLKGKSRISSTGNAILRKALYMPALCCVSKKGGRFKEVYTKLTVKGKPKKVALTAVMRKLLVTANGVLLNGKAFQSDWADLQQKNFALAS